MEIRKHCAHGFFKIYIECEFCGHKCLMYLPHIGNVMMDEKNIILYVILIGLSCNFDPQSMS